jgi:GntR family transcriptional regulator
MLEEKHSEGIPKYIQLAKILREKILAKEYKPGEQIPTEVVLCGQYNVSRITVREAINKLVQEGFLNRRQGRGTYVMQQKLRRNIAKLYSFSSDMLQMGIQPSSRVLAVTREAADAGVAEKLHLPESSRLVICITRIRMANETPVLLETTMIPDYLCPGLAEKDLSGGSLYKFFTEDYQLVLHHAEETYEAIILSRKDAQLLGYASTRPMPAFALQRVAFLESGAPIEFTRSVGRGDMLTLVITMVTDKADFKRVIEV